MTMVTTTMTTTSEDTQLAGDLRDACRHELSHLLGEHFRVYKVPAADLFALLIFNGKALVKGVFARRHMDRVCLQDLVDRIPPPTLSFQEVARLLTQIQFQGPVTPLDAYSANNSIFCCVALIQPDSSLKTVWSYLSLDWTTVLGELVTNPIAEHRRYVVQ